MNKIAAVVLAGGEGKRFGHSTPKQFLNLNGRRVLDYSVELLSRFCSVVVIVCHDDYLSDIENIYTDKNFIITKGGNTRQQSVYQGLTALIEANPAFVLIHDSARPNITVDLLQSGIFLCKQKGSAIPIIPVNDSLASLDENQSIAEYPDRSNLFRIQTPQFFNFETILNAHKRAIKLGQTEFTDDSSMLKLVCEKAYTFIGEIDNIKITQPRDIDLLEFLMQKTANINK